MINGQDSGRPRDLRVSDDVGKMYALGRFDREFAMYGCAYLEAGRSHYIISAQPEKITDFVAGYHEQGFCPSAVLEIHENRPVPSGTRELIAQSIKLRLAGRLRRAYPQDFLEALTAWSEQIRCNEAEPLLREIQDQLEGLFDREKLNLFEGLLQSAYRGRVLAQGSYEDLCRWLALTRRDMADDVVAEDILERVFYGFAYEREDGRLAYSVNAHREVLSRQMYELEQAGRLVTPVLVKPCWYNYMDNLQAVRRKYEQYLWRVYDADYFALLRQVRRRTLSQDEAQAFAAQGREIASLYGEQAGALWEYYGCLWGLKN